jgi:hypothetical protein
MTLAAQILSFYYYYYFYFVFYTRNCRLKVNLGESLDIGGGVYSEEAHTTNRNAG